jgi:hypothetical protein
MRPAARNIIIGVAGAVVVCAAVAVALYLRAKKPVNEKMTAAEALAQQAEEEESEAKALTAEGNSTDADALKRKAKADYDQAVRLFLDVYQDTKEERSTRVTAAYRAGLIQYMRGSEQERVNAISLLAMVVRDGTDSFERFESCRVLASWYWDLGNMAAVHNTLVRIQEDKEMVGRLYGVLNAFRNSAAADTDRQFFVKDHPELGLTANEIDAGPFSTDDERYWTYSRFYRDVADKITNGKTGPEAVSTLFEWCCRNIVTLEEDASRTVAIRPFQRLLVGHGTVEERAWVFCTLLEALWKYEQGGKVLDYDVLVIKTGNGSTLVCASAGDDTRLYDVGMCLPVYGKGGATAVTLEEVRRAEDVLLNTGLKGVAYPYKSADIRDGSYLIPFEPSAAAFREVLMLPNQYVKENELLLHRTQGHYRPLYESAVTKFENEVRKHFFADAVKSENPRFDYPFVAHDGGVLEFWRAPFEQHEFAALQRILNSQGADAEQIKKLDEKERKRLDEYIKEYDATQSRLRNFLEGRRRDLLGDYAGSALWYEKGVLSLPAEKQPSADVLEDIRYYLALALFDEALSAGEKESPDAALKAEKALRNYIDTYPSGRWKDSALFRLGLVYARTGRDGDARQQYERVKGCLEIPAKVQLKRLAAQAH